jgi:hypothetical protein
VILSSVTIEGPRNILLLPTDPRLEIQARQAAVYWDVIDIPYSDGFAYVGSALMQELKTGGILEQSEIKFKGPDHRWTAGESMDAAARMTLATFERRSEKEPGEWSLMPAGPALTLPDDLAQKTRSVEIALYNLLPIPATNVPIDKILEFKTKRADELAHFRASMDDLYQKVLAARDGARAFTTAADEIQAAIKSTRAVMQESFATKVLSSIKVEFTVDQLRLAVLAGLAAATQSWTAAAIAAGTALLPGIKIQRSSGKAPRGLIGGAPFAYVHGVMKDLAP